MKRSYLVSGFAVLVVLALVSLLPFGGSVNASPKDKDGGTHQFVPAPSCEGFEALLGEANCTWTCSDGRTGEAEVLTEEQCKNACEGACGGTCQPADN